MAGVVILISGQKEKKKGFKLKLIQRVRRKQDPGEKPTNTSKEKSINRRFQFLTSMSRTPKCSAKITYWPYTLTVEDFNTTRSQIDSRYKKIEITPFILSDHHRLELDINNRNHKKLRNSWELNNSPLNEKWVKTEIKKKNTV